MFGATSSSRPPVPKTSYWPSTRVQRKARTPPACTPVALEPIATANGLGAFSCFSCSTSASGSSSAAIPAVLASTQPGRSTTATVGAGPPGTGWSPVRASTWATAVAAARCSSSTTAVASSREVSGPGLTNRRAVRPARSQSTRDEGRLIASPYAEGRLFPQGRGGQASGGSPAAAAGEGVGDDVQRALACGETAD